MHTSGDQGLLLQTVQHLLDRIGEPDDPSEILELQGLLEFRDSVRKSNSTAENYLRPRLELLVDLDLLRRQARQSGIVWTPTDITRRCAKTWQPLASGGELLSSYLDSRFFGSMAAVYGRPATLINAPHAVLKYFARAFSMVGREFGFTPGRTVATVACILAWSDNSVLELETVFNVVYEAARSDLGRFLHFSGGSRFDREFLIKVSPELLKQVS